MGVAVFTSQTALHLLYRKSYWKEGTGTARLQAALTGLAHLDTAFQSFAVAIQQGPTRIRALRPKGGARVLGKETRPQDAKF